MLEGPFCCFRQSIETCSRSNLGTLDIPSSHCRNYKRKPRAGNHASQCRKSDCQLAKDNQFQKLHRLHKQHGPIVRVGPNELSIGDHRYYRLIYTDSKSVVKDPAFYAAATFVGHDNIFQMTLEDLTTFT